MRTSVLTSAVAMIGASLGSGLAWPSPPAPGAPPSDTGPGRGISLTLGAGAGFAPDYEGSKDYERVPFWNLRAGNLDHPQTYIQVLGPTRFPTSCPTITGDSASPASSSGTG